MNNDGLTRCIASFFLLFLGDGFQERIIWILEWIVFGVDVWLNCCDQL